MGREVQRYTEYREYILHTYVCIYLPRYNLWNHVKKTYHNPILKQFETQLLRIRKRHVLRNLEELGQNCRGDFGQKKRKKKKKKEKNDFKLGLSIIPSRWDCQVTYGERTELS